MHNLAISILVNIEKKNSSLGTCLIPFDPWLQRQMSVRAGRFLRNLTLELAQRFLLWQLGHDLENSFAP
jgi:hypothetical protein